MTSAIYFENVSKKFTLETTNGRSIQDLLTSFWKPSNQKQQPSQEIWPVKNLSFEIPRGSTVGIVGRNGAGKSTLLKLATGILKPTNGKITINGSMAAMLELGTGFHPDLTGRENLHLYGTMFGLSRKEMDKKIPDIIEFSELARYMDMPLRNYSSGMQVRLGFAAATQVETDVLLLDEVLAVGDYAFQKKCWLKFQEFQALGKTIVLISHDLDTIQEVCDQAILIERGQCTASGEVNKVIETYYTQMGNGKEEQPEQFLVDEVYDPASYSSTRIISVELLDKQGVKIETTTGEQPVKIRVKYQTNAPIKDALFGVQIWGEVHERVGNQVVCHDTSTNHQEHTPLEINGEGSFEIEYPALSLSPGTYFLRTAIFSPELDQEPYATSFRVSPFEVTKNQKGGTGLVSMPHKWKIGDID